MSAVIDKIIKKLEEEKNKKGSLPQLLEFYQNLLRIESRLGTKIAPPKPRLTKKTINSRLEQGLPLLGFDDLVLDRSLLPEIYVEVSNLFARYPALFGPAVEKLKELEPAHIITPDILKAWFEGARLPLTPSLDESEEALLNNIIQASIQPFLVSYAQVLLPLVNQERWRRGFCPICGGSPDFAFLDEERGARYLLCSRCDTEWLFQRLECPYCGTQDQNDLAYFTDEAGTYRLYVCEHCQRYLKAIDLRQAQAETLLPLERIYTLDLDRQAQERGYLPRDKATETK